MVKDSNEVSIDSFLSNDDDTFAISILLRGGDFPQVLSILLDFTVDLVFRRLTVIFHASSKKVLAYSR
jgi:hypothetical protein